MWPDATMETTLTAASLSYPLDRQGIATSATIFANLGTAPLVEHAVRNGEGLLSKDGPLVVETGKHTGRSAKDKFIVRDAETRPTLPRSRKISSPRWRARTSCMSPTCSAARSPNTASMCA